MFRYLIKISMNLIPRKDFKIQLFKNSFISLDLDLD